MGKWDDLDEFWSLDKLVPKKKSNIPPFSTKEKTASVIVGVDKKKATNTISFDNYKPSDGVSPRAEKYIPEDNRLIKSVEIIPSVDRFDFFDTFRKAALIYYDYKCDKCEFEPFYSYKPQYSQMNTEQKKYYFYWRYMLRNKKYIKTDYSYVYLYAYEILNLPDKISPEQGLSLLCDVWCAYRRELPRLDCSFSGWIRDYCLLYKLPCPMDRIADFLFDVINVTDFKEFYLSDTRLDSSGGTAAMIAYLSDYDPSKSRYAISENSIEYRLHLESAMSRVFASILRDVKMTEAEPVKISNSAFSGSLCTHSVKCILRIEYYPLSGVPKLRAGVTAALKYTENKLRAMLGVKSRLAVKDLPENFKANIDAYFDYLFIKIRKENEKKNIPEYQKLYDAPTVGVSYEDALEIEKSSWDVTARLVGDENLDEYVTVGGSVDLPRNEADSQNNAEPLAKATQITADPQKEAGGLPTDYITFVELLCREDTNGAKSHLKSKALNAEAVTEAVNEYFYDALGDVIIEEYDDFYRIIEDYVEEIENWNFKATK